MHPSIKNRLSSLGLEALEKGGGGGDYFCHCLAPLVGMTVLELRRCVESFLILYFPG